MSKKKNVDLGFGGVAEGNNSFFKSYVMNGWMDTWGKECFFFREKKYLMCEFAHQCAKKKLSALTCVKVRILYPSTTYSCCTKK